MSPLLLLGLAIAFEVVATTSLKLSQGFTRPLPSVIVVVGYGAAFWLLGQALRSLPVSLCYAIWSGVGTVGVAILGVWLFREPLSLQLVVGIALVIAGVILLNGAHAH